ncbi:MAG TPA: hypothetical protein VNC50_10355, partial [Planctomycetia bacterium]|nr:hypothetical protein [Planctomycetia bacterium]
MAASRILQDTSGNAHGGRANSPIGSCLSMTPVALAAANDRYKSLSLAAAGTFSATPELGLLL